TMQAGIEWREFQLGVIADRRARGPQDDLVSILCHSEIDGERLDDEAVAEAAVRAGHAALTALRPVAAPR
ncbi:MAG: hypothetical protein QOC64_1166, partial [Solirubrobacteraceae bacterium]|nr:hypothetical protein [Solirubrobacteraceae bacterium]